MRRSRTRSARTMPKRPKIPTGSCALLKPCRDEPGGLSAPLAAASISTSVGHTYGLEERNRWRSTLKRLRRAAVSIARAASPCGKRTREPHRADLPQRSALRDARSGVTPRCWRSSLTLTNLPWTRCHRGIQRADRPLKLEAKTHDKTAMMRCYMCAIRRRVDDTTKSTIFKGKQTRFKKQQCCPTKYFR